MPHNTPHVWRIVISLSFVCATHGHLLRNGVLETMRQIHGEGGPSCPYAPPSNIYHHLRFVEDLRAGREYACGAPGGQSTIRCSRHVHWRDVQQMYCEVRGGAIDVHAFLEWAASPRSLEFDGAYAVQSPTPPLLDMGCLPDPDTWRREKFGWGGQFWLFNAVRSGPPTACFAWIEQPLFVTGHLYGRGNPYHVFEEVVNTVLAFAVHNVNPEQVQIVVADAAVDPHQHLHPWSPVFERVLSRRRVLPLAALLEPHRGAPAGARVCLRRGAFGVHGGASPMSRSVHEGTGCTNSTLMLSVVQLIVQALDLRDVLPGPARTVTYALRVNASGDFHTQEARERGDQRRLPLEAEQALLRELEAECGRAGVSFEAVDFSSLEPLEQMRRARRSDVLMGMHGAHFIHLLWMHPGRPVVEMQHVARWDYDHHKNNAVWTGHPWIRADVRMVSTDLPGTIEKCRLALRQAISLL